MDTAHAEVAFAAWLKRRWLKPGNCLNHAKVILSVPDDLRLLCRLCMGPTRGNVLHCWLETGEALADLTSRMRLFSRNGYYERFAVNAGEVRRYSLQEIAERMGKGDLTFWGFALEKYIVNPVPEKKRTTKPRRKRG